ncbi:MAG: hypothetical protein JSW63_07465 [Ignavibacterium sp.]|nr:MAG: hypothetical protein JSW63_07465 [Ignavibacterium sp.]
MNLKRISLSYVVTYLMIGGLGLAIVPDLFLKLFQSNQSYGDIMPRVVGMFMIALSGLIATMLYFKDYKYYGYSIAVRTFIVLFLFLLFFINGDPFFVVINVIVLIGLIPSYVIFFKDKMNSSSNSSE